MCVLPLRSRLNYSRTSRSSRIRPRVRFDPEHYQPGSSLSGAQLGLLQRSLLAQPVGPEVRAALRSASSTGGELGIALTFLNSASAALWTDFQLPLARAHSLHALLARMAIVAWDAPAKRACEASGVVPVSHCARDYQALRGLSTDAAAQPRSWYDRGASRQIYCALMWRRVETLYAALQEGISTLLLDVDALVYQDPLCLSAWYPHALIDPIDTPADLYVTAWSTPVTTAAHTCVGSHSGGVNAPISRADATHQPGKQLWFECNNRTKFNGGVYFARATDATRDFFARTLAQRQASSAVTQQHAATAHTMLQRWHCDDQPYLEEQLRLDSHAGRLRALVFDTRLIQSDGQRPEHFCGRRRSGDRCELCDKLIVHASGSGNFTSKRLRLARHLERYRSAGCDRGPVAAQPHHALAAGARARACQRLNTVSPVVV